MALHDCWSNRQYGHFRTSRILLNLRNASRKRNRALVRSFPDRGALPEHQNNCLIKRQSIIWTVACFLTQCKINLFWNHCQKSFVNNLKKLKITPFFAFKE